MSGFSWRAPAPYGGSGKMAAQGGLSLRRRAPQLAGRLAAMLMLAALAGCGMFGGEQREPWRGQAEAQCLARKQVRASEFMQPMKSISGPGACGMDSPFRVTAILNGAVTLKTRGVLACPMIAALEQWVGEVVLPASQKYYGVPVAQIHFGTYACRRMNNGSRGRRSEHSFGNAADFMGMTLADGRSVNVKRGWRGSAADQEFLRTIFTGACQQFSTVLGPGSDAYHYDHLHLDLARHGRGRMICKPVLKWSPMVPAPFEPGPGGALAQTSQGYGAPLQTPRGAAQPVDEMGEQPQAALRAGQDHAGQDHASQDHASHDHAGHDHGGGEDTAQASGQEQAYGQQPYGQPTYGQGQPQQQAYGAAPLPPAGVGAGGGDLAWSRR